ncbi:MAG: hypothetical protein HUU20_10985 [Pirellulales bacterium]|nr:hypothetical protein [Pirellulales bacterium]
MADGVLSKEHAEALRASLSRRIEASHYVLGHLGAHLAITAVFAFDVLPIPLGTASRVAWVVGNRLVESVRGHRDRAGVHSFAVLLLAAIPWLGCVAYLLPLRRQSAELTFVLANRVWLSRKGCTYEQFVARARFPVRRIARWLVPVPDPR